MDNNDLVLKDVLRGRNINSKVIPTVANLKPMLKQLKDNNWDYKKLKQWYKRSYKAYCIDKIVHILKVTEEDKWPDIIKINILSLYGEEIGASCLDIYFVAYVAHNYGIGKKVMEEYCKRINITQEPNSVNAIYSVGKYDGEYLGLLNKDGTIKDKEFFEKWINMN